MLLNSIIAAFVGSLSAYLFNLFHWKVVEKSRKTSRIGVELHSIILEIEKDAIRYWLKGYDPKNCEENTAMEIFLKSKVLLAVNVAGSILRLLHKSSISPFLRGDNQFAKQSIETFRKEIYDLVTGDDFESKERKASKYKAMQISRLCSDTKAKLVSLGYCA